MRNVIENLRKILDGKIESPPDAYQAIELAIGHLEVTPIARVISACIQRRLFLCIEADGRVLVTRELVQGQVEILADTHDVEQVCAAIDAAAELQEYAKGGCANA